MGAERQAPSQGRRADSPGEIPRRGWKEVLRRVGAEVQRDQITFVGAAIAFYLMLGFVPLIGAVVSIYGLVADPGDVQRQSEQLRGVVPGEVLQLLQSQMSRLAQSPGAGVALVVGIVLALWSGSAAMEALMTGLNTAYDEPEKRGFFRRKLTSLGLTLASVLVVVVAVGSAVLSPAILHFAHLPTVVEQLVRWLAWPVLLVLIILWVSVIYRFGPSRDRPKWRWVSWGAAVAALIWVAISAGFSFYVSRFGNYQGSYGSLGAVMILLLWFYLSALATLLGAELNAELEHQTARDSTEGTAEPLGKRGAHVADEVAPDEERRKAG